MEKIVDVLSKTGDGAFVVDQRQNILYWSDTAQTMLGYTPQEAVGQKCYELLKGCNPQGQLVCRKKGSIFSEVAKGGRVRFFDLLVHHQDGHQVLIGVRTIAAEDRRTQGGELGLVHTFHLINERPDRPGVLRIHLLGQTMVERPDGSMVAGRLWQRVKVRALFIMLALTRGRPVSRERIVDTLWPDQPHDPALRNLNTTVYNLRRCLEPALQCGRDSQYILYEEGNYLLTGEPKHWIDVTEFDTEIRLARHQPDPAQAIKHYERALALYRGGYLTDISTTNVYNYGEHLRLEDSYIAASEALGHLYEDQGRYRKAKNLYLKILAIDPCRETACQKLMQLLLENGDRASAAAHGRRLHDAMDRELNMVPGIETRILCDMVQYG